MKIRIKGNSIRLRLSKTEVDKIVHYGEVADHSQIGNKILTYKLIRGNYPALSADYDGDSIVIKSPESNIHQWDTDDRIGFDGKDSNGLYILIEKDFQCLTHRNEDESDLYPNPNIGH